jgi:hypothetical protein
MVPEDAEVVDVFSPAPEGFVPSHGAPAHMQQR